MGSVVRSRTKPLHPAPYLNNEDLIKVVYSRHEIYLEACEATTMASERTTSLSNSGCGRQNCIQPCITIEPPTMTALSDGRL